MPHSVNASIEAFLGGNLPMQPVHVMMQKSKKEERRWKKSTEAKQVFAQTTYIRTKKTISDV